MRVSYAPTLHIIPAELLAAYSRETGADAWQAVYLASDVRELLSEWLANNVGALSPSEQYQLAKRTLDIVEGKSVL